MEKLNTDSAIIFVGNIAHCNSEKSLHVFNGFVVVERGKITSVGSAKCVEEICQSLGLTKYVVTEILPSQFIIPGLVDCHLHAPQFPNLGLGLDKPLLDWLASYTFPLEKQYEDVNFARNVYKSVVWRTLRNGTTTACYFGSLHLESSVALAEAAGLMGQRALVGKVSMNVPNPARYYNKTNLELTDTENFVKRVREMKNDLIEPIITPRFALSCDTILMKRLAQLAEKYKCRIQSHVSENLGEIELVKKVYPEFSSYCDVYYQAGLLTDKCILAHGVHLEDTELALLASRGVSIAHCPASNTRLQSGLCPLRKLMQRGITVGLGTDVSGGDSPSIMDAMRRCMDVSTHIACLKEESEDTKPISWKEAFYLATLGGAKALSMDNVTGNFEVGKDFDALIVDIDCHDSPIDIYKVPEEVSSHHHSCREDAIACLLQQFVYLGDDRNITKVFVKGKEISF